MAIKAKSIHHTNVKKHDKTADYTANDCVNQEIKEQLNR